VARVIYSGGGLGTREAAAANGALADWSVWEGMSVCRKSGRRRVHRSSSDGIGWPSGVHEKAGRLSFAGKEKLEVGSCGSEDRAS
jgi:hypothetical protein